jgi:hypothetical protein
MNSQEASKLVETLRKDLRKRRASLLRLSRISGLPHRWIVAFTDGQIREPSFPRVVELARYLGLRITVRPGAHFDKFNPEAT